MLFAPGKLTSSLASQLLPCPPSTGDSVRVTVRSCPSSAQNPPLAHTQSNGRSPTTACKSPHRPTSVNSQHSPPPALFAPIKSSTLFLKLCMPALASGPLHLLCSLPGRTLPRTLMAHSFPSSSQVGCHLLSEAFTGHFIKTFNCFHPLFCPLPC